MADIIPTCHPDRIIIRYEFKLSSNNLVWDLKHNQEIESFNGREHDNFRFYLMPPKIQVEKAIYEEKLMEQAEKDARKKGSYVNAQKAAKQKAEKQDKIENGKDADGNSEDNDDDDHYTLSHHGYMIFDKYYVNMKTVIPNPTLVFGDEYLHRSYWEMGPRVNSDESVFLLNGNLYTTYSYQDIYFRSIRNESLPRRIEACKYFVNRQSIVSDMATEDDKLARVFEIWKQEPLMFLFIVTPNRKNITPIEEAIDNNSPKVVEMCLSHLYEVQRFKLSKAFYHKFLDLFDMGIEAFLNFLSTCHFVTEQMDMMKKMSANKSQSIYRFNCISSVLDDRLNKRFLSDKKIKSKSQKDKDYDDNEESDKDDESDDDEGEFKDDETLLSDVSIPEIDNKAKDDISKNNVVERRIEVKAIEFDWILTTVLGEAFLEKLSTTDNLRYFEIEVIKNVVMFQWEIFLPRIIAYLFTPFIGFFLLFILYTTWILNEKQEETDDSGPWHTTAFTIGIIVLVFQLFFVWVEVNQLRFHGRTYFTSFWNWLDLLSIMINALVVIMDLTEFKDNEVNVVACISVLVLWFRLFYLLRVFADTAYLISMIQAIILEMKYFVLALVIAILAFSNTFYILGRNADDGNFTGDHLWDAFIYTYKMGLGDFDTDNFDTSDETLLWILWFMNTLIILIILLNLVIAIMGDTFDRVQETQESTMLQEFSSIMRENEFMIGRR